MARVVYTDISGQERSAPLGPNSPVVTVGRATDCTIRSNRKSVSRQHAEFRYDNGQFEVIDLNSSNGTYVIINDERKPIAGREFLAPNDEVWCGDFILHLVSDEEGVPPHSAGGMEYRGFEEPRPKSGPRGGLDDDRLYEASLDPGWEVAAQHDGPDSTRDRSSELERLEAERQSIEDLASRQARELEDLQARLETEREKVRAFETKHDQTSPASSDSAELEKLRAELDDLRGEKRRLEEKLHTALQTSNRTSELEAELQEARSETDDLARDLEASVARAAELEERLADKARLLESSVSTDELEALESEVDRLGSELAQSQEALLDAEKKLASSRDLVEESADLRGELDRHKRLVDEFEQRNDELQSEIGGLKQRLKLEKERVRNAEESSVEEHEATISVQNERIEELEAQLESLRSRGEAEAIGTPGAPAASVEEVRGHVEALDRIVDAIERADLDQLTTIDRVRLESAIRDTQPKDTLSALKALLGSDEQ